MGGRRDLSSKLAADALERVDQEWDLRRRAAIFIFELEIRDVTDVDDDENFN